MASSDSSDSMDEDVTKFYDKNPTSLRKANTSSSAEASSHSGDTKEISQPPSNKQKKKMSRERKKNIISTPSQPSNSIKRSTKRQGKEETKPSSKKMKRSAQLDDKENAMAIPGAEKSPRKRGLVWTAKDEVALLKRLVAYCDKGKLRSLPKNMGAFYEIVRKDLDGPYNNEQMYKKLKGLKAKFLGARDKIKNKGFVSFKNAHEETVFMLSKQIWGNREEEEAGSEQMGKEGNARLEEKKLVVGDGGEEREVKRNKNGEVEMAVKKEEGEEEDEDEEEEEEDGNEDGDDDEEAEEEGHDKGEQNGNVNMKKEVEASYVSESVRNSVAGMDTEKAEENVGEETDSSEENMGEEDDSSEESENESSGKEKSAQRDSNAVVKRPKSNIRDNSAQRDPNISLKQSNGRENSIQHVLNSAAGHHDAGDNSRQKVAEGMSDKRREAAASHHDAGKNLSQSVEEGKSDARRHTRGNLTPNDASGKSNGSKRIGATEHNKTEENLMHGVANRMSKESRGIETPIARENSTLHVFVDRSNEGRRIETTDLHKNEENLAQHISKGTANGSPCIATDDQHLQSDQLGKENMRILNEFKSQMLNENQETLDKMKNEIVNMVMKELQGSSNTARHTNLDSSMIKCSSARELPVLSDKEVEMLDRKWRKQQLVELEAASKHIALLQEEYQLRVAKLRHK